MSALDSLTVAITNFRRPGFLRRALASVHAAGIRNVVIATSEPSAEVLAVIAEFAHDFKSYIVHTLLADTGCNASWMIAAYRCTTSRLVLLHDDDVLAPEFGSVYESLIAPEMDRGSCIASWRANLLFDDGKTKPTEYFHGPTRTLPSSELARIVNAKGRLSLSPVVSVLDRLTIINAAKESEQTLTHNDCLYRPGMLLGTEIVAYLRSVRNFPRWLYVDQILSRYGSHDGSGTIYAEKNNGIYWLAKGYDIARLQCRMPPPKLNPKIIFVYYDNETTDADEIARNALARESWDFHFGQGDMIELPVRRSDLNRSSADLGDTRDVPFVRDLFDAGCRVATQDDVVVVCNRDIVLSSSAVERLVAGVIKGKGVTCCQRRRLDPAHGRTYKHFANCKTDGGFDVFAVTPGLWKTFRDKMPDMVVGREGWDSCFRTLAEEHADGRRLNQITTTPEQWNKSNAYADHVAGHKNHMSNWIVERTTSLGNLHNRALARDFFKARGNHALVAALS